MDGGVVMVRRSIQPGYGLWVLPGGFVDPGEVVEEAVVRETQEETYLTVRPFRLLNIYSYPNQRTVSRPTWRSTSPGNSAPEMRPWRPGCLGSRRFPGPRSPFLPPRKRSANISPNAAVSIAVLQGHYFSVKSGVQHGTYVGNSSNSSGKNLSVTARISRSSW